MSRIGINPARGKLSAYKPARVSVCVLTYVPEESGYFEQRLQVIKLVFASLQAHTSIPYDLLVFDNGSCPAAVATLKSLQEAGVIDYLFLSRQNIGKIGALRLLFEAAPGEIIAYNDDDILFYPGWLEAHLQILESFPKAGMVSGVAVRNAARHARASLDALASNPPAGISVSYERRIPDAWESDWANSTGRDPQAHLASTRDDLDMVLSEHNKEGEVVCQAIAAANHFQFVARRERLLQALPGEWSGKLMGAMIELDEAIDHLGYLRLSTCDRFVRHMGNTISPETLAEAIRLKLVDSSEAAGLQQAAQTSQPRKRSKADRHWLLRIPGSRRVLSQIYNRLFEILYR